MSEQKKTGTASESLAVIIAVPMFIGPCIFGWQIINWLQTAKWKPITIANTFEYFEWPQPHFAWLGFQKIANLVFDLPLSLTSFLIWLALFVCLLTVIDERNARTQKKGA